MVALSVSLQREQASDSTVNLQQARRIRYGRSLEQFVPGDVFVHPRGYTFDRGNMLLFARTFHQANPLYLNLEYAKAHGFADLPASPQMVFNVVLSLGVQNDSEKAMANLGYYDAAFLRPVYSGDTLRGYTRVLDRKERGTDKPGIVTIQTLAVNQHGETVMQYRRKIMVGWGDEQMKENAESLVDFPWQDSAMVECPVTEWDDTGLTGDNSYFDDFQVGDILIHATGRTITDEHMALTYQVGNTHPLHFDRLYSTGLSGKMSGEPIVYGGLVFAWLEGLASRDVSENALWELGFTEGYHTQPVVSGDTVCCLSRVLAAESLVEDSRLGVVTFQLIGVKNSPAAAVLDQYGEELFIKENSKPKLGKTKIPEKIFEIERRLLIKRQASFYAS